MQGLPAIHLELQRLLEQALLQLLPAETNFKCCRHEHASIVKSVEEFYKLTFTFRV